MTLSRCLYVSVRGLSLTVLGLLVACGSSGTAVRMNISPEELRTPPHRMSKVDYPFDANGNYIDAWAAGNSSGVAPSYINTDLEDRGDASPTPPPIPPPRPAVTPPVAPLPSPPPLTTAPTSPRPIANNPYPSQSPQSFGPAPTTPSGYPQQTRPPAQPTQQVIPVQPYRQGQPTVSTRPATPRPTVQTQQPYRPATTQPRPRPIGNTVSGPDGRPLPPAYRVPAGN
jgi:hypothetical protein